MKINMLYGAVVCALWALPLIVADNLIWEPSSLTTPSLIESHGYPVEEHTVTTNDGYILTMHRIPFSSKTLNDTSIRPVAFLMHGLLCSSIDWVLSGPGKAFAYMLSDKGFDVWMGNARGNRYSRNHITKNPFFNDFWDFGWHQIAKGDLPAMIDYAINLTGVSQISYIGHSQGTTTFLVLNSLDGTFKNRIRSAHLLAPVAYWKNSESSIVRSLGPVLGWPYPLVQRFVSAEFFGSSKELEVFANVACTDASPTQDECANALYSIFGYDSPYLNKTMIPEILSSFPAGASTNQGIHFLQLYNSGRFCQFDYGVLRNMLEYGRWSPPDYDLASIDVPTFLYYSDNDLLAAVPDVEKLIKELRPSTVKAAYRIPETKWNHGDFLWGINATDILYNLILKDIYKYLNNEFNLSSQDIQ